jgi:two-component sensor histidine kinase
LVGVAFAIRYAIFGWVDELPFALFFPAVMVAAVLFDRGSGLFATALSAGLTVYFFMGESPFSSATNNVRLILFVLVGGFIAIAAEALHQAYVEAEQAHAEAAAAYARAVAAEQRIGTLLREFRHRVGNDLQRIVAVLRLHAKRSPEAKVALVDAANRVQAIARLHDRLGRDAGHGTVDTRQFLHDLVEDFRKSVNDLRPIGFFVEAEAHQLTVSRLGAVGLILNELVTNALKHAFPEQEREGGVTVKFHRRGSDFILCVADDGIGHAAGVTARGGLGMHLVKALAAQLGGHIDVDQGPSGTTQRLIFPVKPPGGSV